MLSAINSAYRLRRVASTENSFIRYLDTCTLKRKGRLWEWTVIWPRNQYVSTFIIILRDVSVVLLCLNKFVKRSILRASYIYTDRETHIPHTRQTNRDRECNIPFFCTFCLWLCYDNTASCSSFSLTILESLVTWNPTSHPEPHIAEIWRLSSISIPVVFDIISGIYSAFSVCNGDEYNYK